MENTHNTFNVLSKILEENSKINRDERKELILSHIELVKECDDTEELYEIVKCRKLDVEIRRAAAEKITDKDYLAYLLLPLTFGIDDDNVELILYISSKVNDEEYVQNVMSDVLLGYISKFREELFDKVLAKVNNTTTLEKFIETEERKGHTSKWIDKAYERAMQLLENE